MAITLYPGIPFSPQAALADNIGAADTIIRVTDTSAFPDAPNLATIGTDEDGETILYAAKTADALSGCVRGVEGNARQWSSGEAIGRNFTAKDHKDLISVVLDGVEKLAAKQDKLTGLPGQVVGFDGMGLAYAVRGWSNPNLLRNWYFVDPINQRGQTEYTGNGYTIDGWGMAQGVSCKLIVSDGYVSVHIPIGATFYQHIENGAQLAGETVSLTFLCCNNELVTTTVQVPLEANSMTSKNVTIDNNPYKFIVKNASPDILIFIYGTNNIDEDASIKPVAAKLELGPVQTLAHQDAAGNWVLNDPPPDKALELAKCQRYYLPQLYATATYTKTTYWAIGAMFPVTMRTTPTFNKNVKFSYFGESSVSADVNSIIGDKYGVRYLSFNQSAGTIVDTSKRYGIELYDISAEL